MPTLDWLNRANAFTTAAQVPYRLLEPVSVHKSAVRPELVEGQSQDNLLIQGDNLEAVKALLPFYRGQVKCIFIDPPYNTKSAFEHYDDNLEHAQWLSMMLPRLQLLRELLREDGSIWVTIDDNEGHYLKVLMDEVFGRKNFIANVIWQKKYAKQNDALWLSTSHDHVFAYGKNAQLWRPRKVARTPEQLKGFTNPDNDPRGPWQSVVYTCAKTRSERPNLFYALKQPKTQAQVFPLESRVWGYDQGKHAQHVAENRLWWGLESEKEKPRLKVFLNELSEGVVPDTLWLRDLVGDNQDSKREGLILFGGDAFTTPKPERLMRHLLDIATAPGDLVLDSFLGSGTTAAVAHKMGRRWIGIEMGEHAATHCLPRLQKVVDGEQGGISQAVKWQGGGGFRFMRLGAAVFDESGRIHPAVRFATLAAFIWQQETGTAWPGDGPSASPDGAKPGTPYLGTHYAFDSASSIFGEDLKPISPAKTAQFSCYLLFNGILGDKRPASGNVLTQSVLDALLALHASTPEPAAPLLVYGEACRLGAARLALANVTFKHIPYDVRAR